MINSNWVRENGTVESDTQLVAGLVFLEWLPHVHGTLTRSRLPDGTSLGRPASRRGQVPPGRRTSTPKALPNLAQGRRYSGAPWVIRTPGT